jgi:cephalosporin hydroxylase
MKHRLTRELITEHKDIADYLPIGEQVRSTIDGRPCGVQRLPFLALIADLMREAFPERFTYLETGTLFGGSLCALSFHRRTSAFEKYAGIDIFSYYGEGTEPSSGVDVSIERADRNVRYFGVNTFALFEGDSHAPEVAARALAYLRDSVTMLYVDGDHSAEGIARDFEMYAKHVVPGGVVVFDDYHDDAWPEVTEAIDALDLAGWNVVGPIAPAGVPTLFVLQRENELVAVKSEPGA